MFQFCSENSRIARPRAVPQCGAAAMRPQVPSRSPGSRNSVNKSLTCRHSLRCASVAFRRRLFRLESAIAVPEVEIGWALAPKIQNRFGTKGSGSRTGEIEMKKFLLGTVGLVALSLSAPASAADLAARPYTKAPPPMIAAIYDWSGFYVGLNGGWGSSRKCWDIDTCRRACRSLAEGCHDATGGTVGGQIGYRWQARTGCSAWKRRATGLTSSGSQRQPQFFRAPSPTRSRIDAFGLFTGQIGYAFNNALLYVKGGAAVTADRYEHTFDRAPTSVFDSARRNPLGWRGRRRPRIRLRPELVGGHRIRPHVHGQPRRRHFTLPARRRALHASIASARTSISSPSASTTAGVARSSRSTDLLDRSRFSYERPASRRPFCWPLGSGRTADAAGAVDFLPACGHWVTAFRALLAI